jgi:hypothetical protein
VKIEVDKEFLEKLLDAFGSCLGLAEAEFGVSSKDFAEEEEVYEQLKNLLNE